MPELPEVEVVRRGVSRWAAGRCVESVQIHDVRSLRRHGLGVPEEQARVASFTTALQGSTLAAPQRRGKFLWIPLQSPAAAGSQVPAGPAEALLIHLGMSGQVLIDAPSAAEQKHLKITLELTRAGEAPTQLRFIDQRIFGGMQISELVPSTHPSGAVPAAAAHIAADPLEPGMDAEIFFRSLRRRRTGLKRAMLDQGMISGIGNIYADEALWHAQLHYTRPTETITRAESARLLRCVEEVMAAALDAGGTSFDSLYVNVNGASGYFDRSLQSYGRAGQPCRRCAGTPRAAEIRRDPFMGRSSHWCPSCQPRPRRSRG
ncbi:bifunctional DNA-formamidopyrimidine glycosylase/DNA-(apurinic or apyrimidinic site) lyase [Nesterenkonia lutea]|uniref:Formamidopyrimidine-DNA glycosylase n=1 Tax=Nesterenkonia lutea TaxID=272919 RepID=A0ABR9JE03_9MICC|nr:bifunctional DNA-formamidopyrimidine glycosylase/DNA-(apurinic or apyrimidinic site) lyase [Nesterenkonia lutea]MBE1524161.1 formamidopyrimidine-DNA glycosylase [Nesterenkonia lutea]